MANYYDEDDAKEGTATTMLSRSVFGGKEVSPGDKITLIVKKVHDDEVSVEYSSASESKEKVEEPVEETEPAMAGDAPPEDDPYA